MEAIVGFVVGYLVGAQEGRGGLDRLRASLKAISASPEARRLAAEALTVAEMVARRASSQGLSGLGGSAGGVAEMLVQRASAAVARRDDARAA
jgi:hypothetical protein